MTYTQFYKCKNTNFSAIAYTDINTRLALSLHTYIFEKRIMQNIYHPRNNTHLLRVFILFLIAFILFLRSMKFSYLCKVINNLRPSKTLLNLL